MNNLYTWLIEIKIKLWTKTSKFWIEIFSWDWEIGIICWIWISNVTIQIYRHRPLTIKIWTGRGSDILASVMATVMLLLASLFLKSLWRMFHVCWKPLDITADSFNLNTWKLKNAWYTNDNRYETAGYGGGNSLVTSLIRVRCSGILWSESAGLAALDLDIWRGAHLLGSGIQSWLTY